MPSIVLWVPFNEGWGQFDAADACRIIRSVDESRPIDHASGWHDQKIGDIQSLHVYFRPYRFRPDKLGRAVILSEFGGYNLRLEGHCWNDVNYGYKGFSDREALWQAYRKLMEEQILPAIPRGLCAAVYTQTDRRGGRAEWHHDLRPSGRQAAGGPPAGTEPPSAGSRFPDE